MFHSTLILDARKVFRPFIVRPKSLLPIVFRPFIGDPKASFLSRLERLVIYEIEF